MRPPEAGAQWAHGRDLNPGKSDFSPQQSQLRWNWQTTHGVSAMETVLREQNTRLLPSRGSQSSYQVKPSSSKQQNNMKPVKLS